MRNLILTAVLTCAACSAEPDSKVDEDTGQAPIDYAAINKAAEAPSFAITLQPMNSAVLDEHELNDTGCNVLDTEGDQVLLVTVPDKAHFMIDGALITLAPKPGSGSLPFGPVTHYDGRAHSLDLEIDRSTEKQLGEELFSYAGSITIRDAKDAVVYAYSGTVECGT